MKSPPAALAFLGTIMRLTLLFGLKFAKFLPCWSPVDVDVLIDALRRLTGKMQ